MAPQMALLLLSGIFHAHSDLIAGVEKQTE